MSLKKISEMTGVSISTVSRVLNGRNHKAASEEMNDKIWNAAWAINYTPNKAAQQLRSDAEKAKEKKKIAINLVFARSASTTNDPFFKVLGRYIEEEILKSGCALGAQITRFDILEKTVKSEVGDNPTIIMGRCSSNIIKIIEKMTKNIIHVGLNEVKTHHDQVLCSGYEAAKMAVGYLIRKGHRKIAYIGECDMENRYRGYYDTLCKHNIPFDKRLVLDTSMTIQGGEAAVNKMLSSRLFPSALFCSNDATAVGAFLALKEHNINIPGDMAVISIDDIDLAGQLKPSLSTIWIPKEAMGKMAVKMLLDRVNGGHREQIKIEFPCKLIKRESC